MKRFHRMKSVFVEKAKNTFFWILILAVAVPLVLAARFFFFRGR